MSTLPARLAAPAEVRAAIEATPDVAFTTVAAAEAASSNDPSPASSPAPAAHATAFSFPAVREPIITRWPSSTSLVPRVRPTIPVPSTARVPGCVTD